jgi:hypothetical protein
MITPPKLSGKPWAGQCAEAVDQDVDGGHRRGDRPDGLRRLPGVFSEFGFRSFLEPGLERRLQQGNVCAGNARCVVNAARLVGACNYLFRECAIVGSILARASTYPWRLPSTSNRRNGSSGAKATATGRPFLPSATATSCAAEAGTHLTCIPSTHPAVSDKAIRLVRGEKTTWCGVFPLIHFRPVAGPRAVPQRTRAAGVSAATGGPERGLAEDAQAASNPSAARAIAAWQHPRRAPAGACHRYIFGLIITDAKALRTLCGINSHATCPLTCCYYDPAKELLAQSRGDLQRSVPHCSAMYRAGRCRKTSGECSNDRQPPGPGKRSALCALGNTTFRLRDEPGWPGHTRALHRPNRPLYRSKPGSLTCLGESFRLPGWCR